MAQLGVVARQRDQARADELVLLGALHSYGQHTAGCDTRHEGDCTCGFVEVLTGR